MDELSDNLENLSVKTYDKAFTKMASGKYLFNELLPLDIVNKIVTEDVLKKELYGKTQNEIHHKKEETIMKAEKEFQLDTEEAEDYDDTGADPRLVNYAYMVRDQKYENYQKKIRLYNKMLRPLPQMSD